MNEKMNRFGLSLLNQFRSISILQWLHAQQFFSTDLNESEVHTNAVQGEHLVFDKKKTEWFSWVKCHRDIVLQLFRSLKIPYNCFTLNNVQLLKIQQSKVGYRPSRKDKSPNIPL